VAAQRAPAPSYPTEFMTWPRDPVPPAPLPATLPGGRPWPRISIVTPSFNQSAFIEETILSVLHQNYPDVEHIVIDGGSTDGTADVLATYRDLLACSMSEPDRGQSHAINKGMARTTGSIVTWLNSDDRLAPGALAGIAMAFHTSGADMVAGICELWRDGQLVDRHLTSCADGPLPLDDLLDLDGCWNAGQFFFQPEVFFTRGLWDRAGAHVDEGAHYSMDYELWLRFAAAGARLRVIGRPVAQFRLHANQKTADANLFRAELPVVRDRFLDGRGLRLELRPALPAPTRPARVVFFNDIGFRYGAGIAHERLATAMAMGRHDVVAIEASSHPRATPLSLPEQDALVARIAHADPDFVIAGNLHSAGLAADFLDRVAARWPTAFVVHDLWIVTGRCAYTKGCTKLFAGCDETCPTSTEYPALAPALIAAAWEAKRRLLGAPHAPLLLANSAWTRDQIDAALAASPSARPRAVPVTLGVGPEFVPADRRECRRLLGLPEDAFLIMLSATSLSDPRKGRGVLLDALSRLNRPGVALLLVGTGEDVEVSGFSVHSILYQDDPEALAQVYAAANLFVGPSLEECLGQVFLEAAACGVPSVGFAVGGVPEAIQDGVTGILVPETTADALADAIRRLYDNQELRSSLSAWARIACENDRSLDRTFHSVHTAIAAHLPGASGLLGRKISLGPPGSRVVGRPVTSQGSDPNNWRALSGFGPWEGPYADLSLPRFRWQESRTASIRLNVSERGRFTLRLRLRNLAPGQRLRITAAGRVVFDGPIVVTSGPRDSELHLDVALEAPQTTVTLQAASSVRSPEGRSLVLLLCGVDMLPRMSIAARLAEWGRRLRTRLVVLRGRLSTWRSRRR
jgi:glycosyltransferase involved in cell wall biosynthesis